MRIQKIIIGGLILTIAFLGVIMFFRNTRIQQASAPSSYSGGHDYTQSLKVRGIIRTYLVHLPPSYHPRIQCQVCLPPQPVVLNFHGGGGEAQGQEVISQMNSTSDKNGFIVVYPQGVGPTIAGHIFGGWNIGDGCCGKPGKDNIDDVAFVRSILGDLPKHFYTDPNRIYATGLSNGSMFALRVACDLSDQIAAVAGVDGTSNMPNCHPSRAVPIMYAAGTADPCIPYEGGTNSGCINGLFGGNSFNGAIQVPSAQTTAATWRTINQCSAASHPIPLSTNQATCITSDVCATNSEVTLCTIQGGGHTWAGGTNGPVCINNPNSQACKKYQDTVGPLSHNVHLNDIMWAFFSRHSLP